MSKVRADVLWHKKAIGIIIFLLESCNIVLCQLTHAISVSWHLSNASSGSWKNRLFGAPVGSRKNEVQEVKMGSCYGISGNREQLKVIRSDIRRLERIRQSFLVMAVNKFLHNSNCAWWCVVVHNGVVMQSIGALFLREASRALFRRNFR